MIKLICLTPIITITVFAFIQNWMESRTKLKEWVTTAVALTISCVIVYGPLYAYLLHS